MNRETHYLLGGRLVPAPLAADTAEAKGIMPREAIGIPKTSREVFPSTPPSSADPTTTCRREMVLKKFWPNIAVNPLALNTRDEGTAVHQWLASRGQQMGGNYHYEVSFPSAEHANHAAVRPRADGNYEAEIFPGVWTYGIVDRISTDFTEITDYKTSRFPAANKKTGKRYDYGVKSDWIIQQNLYRRLVTVLTGVTPDKLVVWRFYNGSYEPSETWKKFDIPLLSDDVLLGTVGPHMRSLREFQEKAATALDITELAAIIATVPMDGEIQAMFNGKKCQQYCDVRDICFHIAGKPNVAFD